MEKTKGLIAIPLPLQPSKAVTTHTTHQNLDPEQIRNSDNEAIKVKHSNRAQGTSSGTHIDPPPTPTTLEILRDWTAETSS